MKYTKPSLISLRNHATLNERWVQERIAEDPSVLGLGDVVIKDKERRQPQGGRLDLLLQDIDQPQRYEVEIQLGQTDETHIIRTIEYWDIERRRYPQYDHVAVIVAEDITSRFLNVIGLFNGFIPVIALQMQALQIENSIGLVFTTVYDLLPLGLVDEDEDLAETVDREYWVNRASPETVALADKFLELFIQPNNENLRLKYNKHYIGVAKDGQAFNFVSFRPKKNALNLEVRLPRSPQLDELIDQEGLDTLEYNTRWQMYRLRLAKDDLTEKSQVLTSLTTQAYDRRFG